MKAVIGQYADYLDTGIWRVVDGVLTPPPDLTPRQQRDFNIVFGELFPLNGQTCPTDPENSATPST